MRISTFSNFAIAALAIFVEYTSCLPHEIHNSGLSIRRYGAANSDPQTYNMAYVKRAITILNRTGPKPNIVSTKLKSTTPQPNDLPCCVAPIVPAKGPQLAGRMPMQSANCRICNDSGKVKANCSTCRGKGKIEKVCDECEGDYNGLSGGECRFCNKGKDKKTCDAADCVKGKVKVDCTSCQ